MASEIPAAGRLPVEAPRPGSPVVGRRDSQDGPVWAGDPPQDVVRQHGLWRELSLADDAPPGESEWSSATDTPTGGRYY